MRGEWDISCVVSHKKGENKKPLDKLENIIQQKKKERKITKESVVIQQQQSKKGERHKHKNSKTTRKVYKMYFKQIKWQIPEEKK